MIDFTLKVKFNVERSKENPDLMKISFTDIYGETFYFEEWSLAESDIYELVVDLIPDKDQDKELEREED